ncbi:MAG: hypothetical protein KGL67_01730 [Patescibacteria group bacterium]|nr:hypothetical protein [Patescibacteria group bacterium]
MPNLKKVISLHQAATISGYHQDYLSSLLRKNEIRGEKLGGNWFTTEEEIKDYIFKKKIRNKNWIAKNFLFFVRKNTGFIYAFILLAILLVGIYFYDKYYVEIKNPTLDTQFSGINKFVPKEEVKELKF